MITLTVFIVFVVAVNLAVVCGGLRRLHRSLHP